MTSPTSSTIASTKTQSNVYTTIADTHMMVVSMMQLTIELPDTGSIKEKRRMVLSLRDRVIRRFRVSMSEVDLHNSLTFAELGTAMVSNSREHGERVMNKILKFVEDEAPGRVQDVVIHSEFH